jgi:hypothetical protein
MIVTALPPTRELVDELVGLARASWDPPELLRYLHERADRVEPVPAHLDGIVFSFPTAGPGLRLHAVAEDESQFADELPTWGLWVPFGVLDEDEAGIGEVFVDELGWTELPDGPAGFDDVWERACAVVAAVLGAPRTTVTDVARNRVAAWQVGSTALMVVQTADFAMSYELELCAIRLYALDPAAGLPTPEILRGWAYCR